VPDRLGAARERQLGEEVGEALARNVVAVLMRGVQGGRIETRHDPIERRQEHQRFVVRFAMPIVIPATTNGAHPIDVGPPAAIRIIRNPEPVAIEDRRLTTDD
jgi:electron transfer flavoprotein alpha/beta subunit